MQLRTRFAVLLALAWIAAAPVCAQQQPSAEPSVPERVLEGIGDAVRDIFRAIFGTGEGEIPPPQQPAPQQSQPPQAQPQHQAGDGAQGQPQAKPSAPQPVAVTPSAQAAPQSVHGAIAKGDYTSALKLIEQGFDIETKDPGAGASVLHYAVMKGTMPMIGLLLQRGADVNSRTRSGTTPLHTAVLYGHLDVAEYLIDKGAEVNAKSASGATPLSIALAANYQRIEKMLRTRGAK